MDATRIALSGINGANKNLSNTSNNIANSQTVGYKATSVTFAQMVVNNGSQGTGIGVSGGAVTTNFGNGSMVQTGDPLDHSISGSGFFVVEGKNGENLLTRSGDFSFNKEGVLVDSFGNKVQGFGAGSTVLEDIVINDAALPPQATTESKITANFGSEKDSELVTSISVFDSLGTEHQMKIKFDNKVVDATTKEATWTVTAEINGKTVTLGTPSTIEFDAAGQLKAGEGLLDADGKFEADLSGITPTLPGVGKIEVDLTGSTGYDGDSKISSQTSNGRTFSEYDNFKVEADGTIVFSYQGGETKRVAQIALANVDNLNGLVTQNNGYYTTSQAAGETLYGVSGDAGFGMVYSGYLEGSNVDMTAQLVGLIEAQQHYQSNSKVLGVVDENNKALMQVI